MRIYLSIVLLLAGPVFADDLLGLPKLPIPMDNPQTPAKIQLGAKLFVDKRLSLDSSVNCASCHQPEKAFTDGLPVAQGIAGSIGLRNSPTLINAAFFTTLFHDGRASSLEEQALGPLLNPIEHGLRSPQQIVDIVVADPDYVQRMQRVFHINKQQINVSHITKAIASFERTLISANSRFDRYYFGRDHSQLSASEARGLLIFRRKGNCANCHEISWDNALFTDNRFYNIGVGSRALAPVIDAVATAAQQGQDVGSLTLSEQQQAQLGRFNITHVAADIGKFKTPTLRNIALTGPYMHDGSVQTLAEVVDYYDRGGEKNRFLDSAIFPLHLTDREKQDLVAFMQALTSSTTFSSATAVTEQPR